MGGLPDEMRRLLQSGGIGVCGNKKKGAERAASARSNNDMDSQRSSTTPRLCLRAGGFEEFP